jgi:hypothetical protein
MAHSLGLYRNKESHEMAHSLGLYPKFNSCLGSNEIDLGPCALMELGPCFSNLSHTGPYSSKAHSLGLYPKLNSCLWSGMLVCRCSAVLCCACLMIVDYSLFAGFYCTCLLKRPLCVFSFSKEDEIMDEIMSPTPSSRPSTHPQAPTPQWLHYCGLWK